MIVINALKDIVQHINVLKLDLVKVTGIPTETIVETVAEDKSVVISAKFKQVIPEFNGVFGIPNIDRLKVLLNLPVYKENPKLTIQSKTLESGQTVLTGIKFENEFGDFSNEHRFMIEALVNEKIRKTTFKGATWNIDFVPSNENIKRLAYMVQTQDQPYFSIATFGSELIFSFGDHSTHAGKFSCASGITGTFTKDFHWPTELISSILTLPGNKTFKLADVGAALITVDSGLADYQYIIPALQL